MKRIHWLSSSPCLQSAPQITPHSRNGHTTANRKWHQVVCIPHHPTLSTVLEAGVCRDRPQSKLHAAQDCLAFHASCWCQDSSQGMKVLEQPTMPYRQLADLQPTMHVGNAMQNNHALAPFQNPFPTMTCHAAAGDAVSPYSSWIRRVLAQEVNLQGKLVLYAAWSAAMSSSWCSLTPSSRL